MARPQNKFDQAEVIIRRYFQALLKQMADEIIEHREDFESPGFGGQADCIIEKYFMRLQQVRLIYASMKPATSRQKQRGKAGDKGDA